MAFSVPVGAPEACAKPLSSRCSRIVTKATREPGSPQITRRDLGAKFTAGVLAGAAFLTDIEPAEALGFQKDLSKKRRLVIPEDQFKDGPEGLRYADLKPGTGPEANIGARVAIHYDCKWRGITFMTSRQGMGVTGGNPFGFDLGTESGTAGGTLKGLDLGVRGMRVGGQRRLRVPPELAYGDRQVGEIPPGATLDIDVELLSIKSNPFGKRVRRNVDA
ncbi:hypothetical protein BSKO_02160 [Bryopsis sp. KO-2023]|nr:hypothetical protein BSKO_02160 [Bryopsis sp. KO-2023]